MKSPSYFRELSHPVMVCAATEMELKAFLGETKGAFSQDGTMQQRDGVLCAVTGVGIPLTLGSLPPLVERLRPAHLLNIGIAGAYPGRAPKIGDIVIGKSEVYGDVGFELPEEPGFRSIADTPFGAELYAPGLPLQELPPPSDMPEGFAVYTGRGCTVNACTGTERTGRLRAERFDALFESMEGAAAAQVGRQFGIPVSEVRAISNIAGRRDMRPENITLALANLRRFLNSI